MDGWMDGWMDGACSMKGRDKKCEQNCVKKSEWKIPLGRFT
jgi:hypothetical protein